MANSSAWESVYVIAALVTGWGMLAHRKLRATTYRCALCGSRRPDGHSKSCPWNRCDD